MSRKYICLLIAVLTFGFVPMSFAAGFDPDTDPSLVGHWTFDEGAGPIAGDSSGNGNNGTLLGGTKWVDGPWGGAVEFDGIDDYIDTGNTENLEKWTICCLAMSPAAPSGGSPTGPVHREQNYQFDWNHSDATYRAGTAINVGGTWYAAKYEPLEADTWYHLVGTYDGETLCAYRDGQLITANTTPSGKPSSEANTLKFGRHALAAQYFRGKVDEARLFRRALTADEIKVMALPKPAKVKASKPNPADGTVGVGMPLLQWTKGETAMFHSVYLGTAPQLTEANQVAVRQPFAMVYLIQGLQPGVAYYWRVDEIDAAGMVYTGDVWNFVAQALTAYYPGPANGSNVVSTTSTLTWMSPAGATQHHLYLSDSLDAVTNATTGADKGMVTETTFTPAALESLKTYYWRVDETIASGGVKTGPVWSFVTTLPVDDFESYTDDLNAKTTIFDTWIDGVTNGLSGSTVGYTDAPFAERTTVHGGTQSMPLDYNNVQTPFYSEAEREFASPQDWTSSGANELLLYVRGRLVNRPAPVYVRLEDASKRAATVAYPDSTLVTAVKWTPWKIPLSQFAGVNLAKVKKLCIGVGDKADPKPAGKGVIFIDDIAVCISAPVK